MKDNLSGSEALKEAIKAAASKQVEVGWFPTARYPSDTARGREGGEYVAQIAFWLNNGTSTMVARPFFSEAIYLNESEIKAFAASRILKVSRNEMDIDTAMGQIGLFIEGLIIDNIKSQKYAALSKEYYNWKKKFHKEPQILIDTGLLWQSVTSKVGEREAS